MQCACAILSSVACPSLQYFSTVSHKRHDLLGEGVELFIIIVGIQPLGRFGQRPELRQATGMTLVRCILGKFLGVVCHCFPPARDY